MCNASHGASKSNGIARIVERLEEAMPADIVVGPSEVCLCPGHTRQLNSETKCHAEYNEATHEA
ncbi:hypothetical protein W02_04440 [Nitrospira sp. KM1]|nr:hypothetical protein W02_04440 [Nitrospira sp. KM1]